ncbi:major facilitator superfamily [Anaeramoeba flamelloides]|uniref:Major facilitator superfamily n=1 Tax=Anaeramoeba flamelloides TaxID=1746091 RepID=A0AAV7ZHK0_9EUKA|nr:major facilitator superfamily [Anaeramoeba flamelloides]
MTSNKKTQEQEVNLKALAILMPLIALLGPLSNQVYLPSLTQLSEYFDVSLEVITLSVSISTFVGAFSPSVWAPSSDFFGRRRILIIEFCLFIGMSFGCIFAQNLITFVVFRILQSASLMGAVGVCFAVIMDVFPVYSRGKTIALIVFAITIGSIIGPVIGGALADTFGWRSVFVFLLIVGFVIFLLMLLFLKETKKNPRPFTYKTYFFSWIRPLTFLRNKTVSIVAICNGISFSIMLFVEVLTPSHVQVNYGWSKAQAGYSMIPFGIGGFCGTLVGGAIVDASRKKYKTLGSRLYPGSVASFVLLVIILLIGFAVLRSVTYYLVLTGLFSFTYIFIGNGSETFLFELVTGETASVGALMALFQFGFSAISIQLSATALESHTDKWFFGFCGVLFLISFVWVAVSRKNNEYIPDQPEHSKQKSEDDLEMENKQASTSRDLSSKSNNTKVSLSDFDTSSPPPKPTSASSSSPSPSSSSD